MNGPHAVDGRMIIHHFHEELRIEVKRSVVTVTDAVKITCGAKSGEADNRKKLVTCPECKKLLTTMKTKGCEK